MNDIDFEKLINEAIDILESVGMPKAQQKNDLPCVFLHY
jgi:hypothetical protein